MHIHQGIFKHVYIILNLNYYKIKLEATGHDHFCLDAYYKAVKMIKKK